ncbi:MAG: tetratricopeptide repeat protein [Chitinophagaceae bacterium]|jgi:tetratricopeptide (TPR) repeat protein|nr:tetratricopeptide repeat protein [Bacteroidota bacterium]MBP9878749.1 tetratricopeptide repeat protein [Chitinophagales bacterium]
MISKKGLVIGIIGAAVITAGILLAKSNVFKGGNKNEVAVDSLEMAEQLTPQIADLSLQINGNPQNAGLYYARANEYFNFGNLKFALDDYKKAFLLDSTNATLALGLSDCLFELNNADGAIGILKDYLKTDPDNIDIMLNLAIDYYLLPKPQYQKAIEVLNDVLKVDVQNSEAYFYKGMIYKETTDTTKAISNFQTAVEADPDYYDAYMQLGLLYAEQNNDIAIKYFDNAIALNDGSNEAHYAKAKYYQDRGRISEAIGFYKKMIVADPQDANAIYNLATIYFGIDSIQQAYRFYELAIKQAPAKAMGYYGKGLCAEELKNKEEAISLYNQALNLDPDLKVAEERLLILNEK